MAAAGEGLATEAFRPADRPDETAATIDDAAAAIVDQSTDPSRNTGTLPATGLVGQANGSVRAFAAIDGAAAAIVDLSALPGSTFGRVLLATVAVIETAMAGPAANFHRAAAAIGSRGARSTICTNIDGAAIAILTTFLVALAIEGITATIIRTAKADIARARRAIGIRAASIGRDAAGTWATLSPLGAAFPGRRAEGRR